MDTIQDKDNRTNGRWTHVQHQKFMLGIQLYGKNWKKIEQLIGTRTGSQIRSHAQKHFLKSQKHIQFPQNTQPQHQKLSLHLPSSVISNPNSNPPQNLSQYSYFMSRIIQQINNSKDINCWTFIDVNQTKIYKKYSENNGKDTFLIHDDSKIDTSFTHYNCNLVGEQIL